MHTDIPIKADSIIAVMDNKISFRSVYEKHFFGKWYEDSETAEKVWQLILADAKRKYEVEIYDKEYPAINRTRKEMLITERET